ncbi:sterol carrier protein domain-containing protein [Lacticaseibacillus paracasei]|uniref:sterol carrier protein domain-containing protein n=1 Tax=Lacticaseibacillus paracasei TaxID=1597 RepID=UPI001FF2721F|nr:sterol carrier protein domain-containing protein [Lacticaseibacillus paracasei]
MAETVAARHQLIEFIVKHQVTFKEIVYEAPDTDFLLDYLPNGDDVCATIKPYMMARIVNLKNFFYKYPAPQDAKADLVFRLHDDNIADNDGYWHLCVSDDGIELEKVEQSSESVEISIQQLSKIFMGAQTATGLARRGQIIATAEEAAELDSVRVKQSPSLVDYF